jgi:hypothetical protein
MPLAGNRLFLPDSARSVFIFHATQYPQRQFPSIQKTAQNPARPVPLRPLPYPILCAPSTVFGPPPVHRRRGILRFVPIYRFYLRSPGLLPTNRDKLRLIPFSFYLVPPSPHTPSPVKQKTAENPTIRCQYFMSIKKCAKSVPFLRRTCTLLFKTRSKPAHFCSFLISRLFAANFFLYRYLQKFSPGVLKTKCPKSPFAHSRPG